MSKKKENTTPAVETEEEIEGEKKPTKAQRIISTVVNVILVIAILLAVLMTYTNFSTNSGHAPSIFGLRLYSVQSTSMEPTLMKGDLVVSFAVSDPKTLQHGDIITFWTLIDGERVLNTHRIVEISNVNGSLGFTTKGDNNSTTDTNYVHQSDVVGKYSFRIGGVGHVFDYLQTSQGFLLVVVIPVLIFLLYQLIQFFRVLFEYQNVKNRIKFEQERGRTEDLIAAQQAEQAAERARLEAELREKVRAELLAEQTRTAAAEATVPVAADSEEPDDPDA